MSKYSVGEVVLSHFGFDKKMKKYNITNVRYMDKYHLNEIIDFRYEWNNEEQIYNDPYVYDLELSYNESKNEDEYEYKIFKEKKDQLTSQIQKIIN
tara:strand:- start:1829 stop:2116 length:288 start_codon:yes stop_codon:yes gene_type:complete